MPGILKPPLDPIRFPQRRSVRLLHHDYDSGTYFITICTAKRNPLLSRVERGRVLLTSIGSIVEKEWLRTSGMRSDVQVDAFVVMPNHFHGIVGLGVTAAGIVLDDGLRAHDGSRAHAVRPYLGQFVAGFKSACTRRYREIAGEAPGALWQRGYYEHVIRGTKELERIRHYIDDNPRLWQEERVRRRFSRNRRRVAEEWLGSPL